MSVDAETVKRIARLSRIKVSDEDITWLKSEINDMLHWVEQLKEVDVNGVEPMTSVNPMELRRRDDVISDGGYAERVTENSPNSEDHFFLVPKVIE